jgi:hypothetical protein
LAGGWPDVVDAVAVLCFDSAKDTEVENRNTKITRLTKNRFIQIASLLDHRHGNRGFWGCNEGQVKVV